MISIALIGFPLLMALLLFGIRGEVAARWSAFTGSLLQLAWAIFSWVNWEHYCKCSFRYKADIPEHLGVGFQVGMDGVGMMLVMVAATLLPLIILMAWNHPRVKASRFFALLYLLTTALIGICCSFDAMLYLFFLIMGFTVMAIIFYRWNEGNSLRIIRRYILYMGAGSLLFGGALVVLFLKSPTPHSFDFRWLLGASLTNGEQITVALAFLGASAVFIPLVPLHRWLSGMITSSPVPVGMALTGILFPAGLYGVIRWGIPRTMGLTAEYHWIVILAALTGALYITLVSFRRNDLKLLIASYLIAQAGLITAGFFALNQQGFQGSVLLLLSAGLTSTGLLAITGMMETRHGALCNGSIRELFRKTPRLTLLFLLILPGTIAFPLTGAFAGAIRLVPGLFAVHSLFGVAAGLILVLWGVRLIRVIIRTTLSVQTDDSGTSSRDVTWQEAIILIAVILFIFLMGIYPSLFLPA